MLAGTNGQRVAWAVLVGILAIHSINFPLIEGIRNRSFDLYQRLAPRPSLEQSPVVVVDIDEKSLSEIGQWPWGRNVMAALVQRLTESGAVVIGFDMVFSEEDRLSPPRLARQIVGLEPDMRERLAALPDTDRIFASAIARSRVVLGGFVSNEQTGGQEASLERIKSINWMGQNPSLFVKRSARYVGNVPVLEAAATGHSNFTLDNDFDGVIRRIPLFSRVNETLIPILGLEMLRVATGKSVLIRAGEQGIEGVVIAGTLIPTDGYGRMWIRFSRRDESLYLSAADILSGRIGPERVAGRLVLMGTSATGLKDLRSTPVEAVVPGVEVHAQMLQTVLTGNHLYRGDLMRAVEWLTILGAGLLLIIVSPLLGATAAFTFLLGIVGASSGLAAYLFLEKSILMDITFIVGSSVLLFFVLVYSSFRSVEEQRSQIRSAFGHYLSPELVDRLAREPDKLKLGGEVRTLSFLFCDIRGFTEISETYDDDPEGLTRLINDFLTPMSNIIMRHGGTIDKYMGDCIMAFWNAPMSDPDHALHAVLAARDMQRELMSLNFQLQKNAEEAGHVFTPIKVGIGINTGSCVVGNMGSEHHFDYSVLGDAVNLASRLEGQCKAYGVDIIVGDQTAQAVEGMTFLELDLLAVKGKMQAVRIFAFLDEKREDSRAKAVGEAFFPLHNRFLHAYRAKQWAEARGLLSRCLTLRPDLATLYEAYDERITEFEQRDPGPDWKGVHKAAYK
ncbi:guanylate cyclase [Sneathiella chinensis]|uniref:Guanylate cyclase n=1 Tax=Sneathiella chinensis TaxID=349750 RepID=A0ABQ5U703_9PROT|nr:guanylate cyclase [Sneathiella chinensis]